MAGIGFKGGGGRVAVRLVGLTCPTAFDEATNHGVHPGPPIVAPEEFQSSVLPGVSSRFRIVVSANEIASQLVVGWDIAAVLVED